jgi:hypothetical protein
MRHRDVSCVASSGSGVVFPSTACTGPRPPFSEQCNVDACRELRWMWIDTPAAASSSSSVVAVVASVGFGPCSSRCDDGTSAVGVAVRPAAVCVDGDSVTLASRCHDAGLPAPLSSTPCNRFACPTEVYTWRVSEWSSCRYPVSASGAVQQCLSGERTADVTCVAAASMSTSTAPVIVPDDRCRGNKPASTQVCAPATSECSCVADADCVSVVGPNSVCGSLTTSTAVGDTGGVRRCECRTGWLGVDCSVPQLYLSSGAACTSGVVSSDGACCDEGAAVNATGYCCGRGAILDAMGSCCAAGTAIDVCGVCGGSAVAVDVFGSCCATALPPSGVCCTVGVDECGVCGGVNSCHMSVSLSLSMDAVALSATSSAGFLLGARTSIASSLRVAERDIASVELTVDGVVVKLSDVVAASTRRLQSSLFQV